MVVEGRRNIRSEVIARALSPSIKEAPQNPEEFIPPPTPIPEKAQRLSPKEQRISYDVNRLQATVDYYASEQARILEELNDLPRQKAEAIARIEAEPSPYGKAQKKYSVSKRFRRQRDRLRRDYSNARTLQKRASQRIDVARKAERTGTTPQAIVQQKQKFEAQQRSAEARRDRNQEAFIESQGQEAWNEASPEAKRRIRETYVADAPPSQIKGVTDLNKLSEQYSTAGEFLPEVQRRIGRGETVSVTRKPLNLGVVRRTSPLDSDTAPTIANAERLREEQVERLRSTGGVMSADTGQNPFVETQRRKGERLREAVEYKAKSFIPIVENVPLFKELVLGDPELKAQYVSGFRPEEDRALISGRRGDPLSSEYWKAQARLTKGSFLTTVTGITGGSQVEKGFFVASLVAPQTKFLKTPGSKGILKRFSDDTIQAFKDTGTATVTSLFVGQRDVSGAELFGTGIPYVVGGGLSAYASSTRFTTDLNYLREGVVTAVGTKAGKRGTRGRKPKSLAQRSKESRGAGMNPNINFDVQAGQVVVKRRLSFKEAPGLSRKERKIVVRVDPRQLVQPGAPQKARAPSQNRVVYTLSEQPGGRVTVDKQFTTARELSRYTRSQSRAGVGRATRLQPGEFIVAQRKPSKVTQRFADRFKEEKVTRGTQEVSPGILSQQQARTESVAVFNKRTKVSTREASAVPDLKRGFFSSLGETLAPRKRQQYQVYDLVEQPRAPRGFRPGTREALLGRVRSKQAERLKYLEGISITPRSEIKILGAPRTSVTPEAVIGLNLGSGSRSEFDLKPSQDTFVDQEVRLTPAQEVGQTQIQIQGQEQIQDQELAFKSPPVRKIPRATPLPKAPEPFTPTTRPPKRPPEERKPRIPPPSPPKRKPPQKPPMVPRIPPPKIPFPKIKFGQALTPAYDVFANIKGEFQKIGTGLTRSGAISTGVEKISKTALASFKISKTGELIREEDEGLNKRTRRLFKQFRKPKKSSKLRTNDFTFVEKRKFRIDTPGELQDITYKGIKASRRRRL